MLFAYETNRLHLEILRQDRAEQVLDFYLRDKALFERYETDRAENFYTKKYQKQVLAFEYNMALQGSLFRFYVYEKNNPGQIVGTICFHHIERGCFSSCEVGYKFSSAVHHRGYATEALGLVLQLIFGEMGLHRVTALVQPDNEPSIRLLERMGFSCEGVCRGYLWAYGQWRDLARFSRLATDQSSDTAHIQ